MDEVQEKVFQVLCDHAAHIMDGWMPFPCHLIAKQAGLSEYKTRKALKALVKDGYAVHAKTVINTEDYSLPYHGFNIGMMAYDTPQYRAACEREAEICAECFGGTKESYLRAFLKFRG